MITQINKETLSEYNAIKTLKSASREDVLKMEQFTKKYIDPKVTICRYCSAQIRFAFARIKGWGESNYNKMVDASVEENIIPEQTIEHTCECGVVLLDKRRKQCKDCKTK